MVRALIPVLLAVFLDLLGFGIVIPLLTFYAEDYGASALQVTMLMACYSLAQLLMAPVWGAISDRYGRRPVLLASIGAAALFLSGFAAADQLWMLFLFRTLHGASAANISTAQAAVADLTPPEKRAMGMGLIGAAFGVGFTLGPWLGGELSRWGHATPIWLAAGLSALNFLLALFLLPETRGMQGEGAAPAARRTLDPRRFAAVLRHPVVGLCVGLTFLTTIAFAMMESTFTLFAEHARGLDAPTVGRYFGVAGLVMIFVQGGLIGRLVKRFGEAPLVPVGLLLLTLGLALLPFAPPPLAMVSVFVLIAIGQGISTPSLQALISKGTSVDEQGFVLGTNQSMSALARVVGPLLGGLLFAHVLEQAPFLGASALLGVGFLFSFAALKRWREGTRALHSQPPDAASSGTGPSSPPLGDRAE
ncbi:MAG: MFS transporter [Alphaproteobacteria bacterium]|nr:MFS transporter [Alphaproteobacteria bacterium]